MKEKITVISLALLLVGGAALFYALNKTEYFPTFCISMITLSFSYYAYLFSKEKFRLDLLDKRWEAYEQIVDFCKKVSAYGGFPKETQNKFQEQEVYEAFISAIYLFNGMGAHKVKSLFGEDVQKEFQKLRDHYVYFVTRREADQKNAWLDKEGVTRLEDVLTISQNLPSTLKSYMYFGDYKK